MTNSFPHGPFTVDNSFARLISLHDGLPAWFPKVIRHILRFLQGRDRLNLYNTCRALAVCCPDLHLSTQQLRNTLQCFSGQGLRFTGSHAQKVIFDKRLVLFWNHFLIPACETSPHDLAVFQAALQEWRFKDLTKHPIMRPLLPPSYRSFTKESLARHCLRALFGNPNEYERFAEWQAAHLSPAGLELYSRVSQTPQAAQDIIRNSEGWPAVYELWNTLLLHPAYDTCEEKIFLRLGAFQGFTMPFRLTSETATPALPPDACLEPIQLITSRLLQDQIVSQSAGNCKRTFFERQLDIFKEGAGDSVEEIRQLLTWWQETIGSDGILPGALPPPGCLLVCSASGRYVPFMVARQTLKPLLETSLKFGLLTENDKSRLTLSPLGRLFISGRKPELGVKTIWARNIDRLSLHLGEGWGEGFRRFLRLLATTSQKGGEYVVTPASLANSGLRIDQVMVIISGFVRLDPQRQARLEHWAKGH